MWIDNHCHLPRDDATLAAQLVDEARASGVTRLVNVGCDVAESRAAIEVARVHDGVWATAGVHPHDAKQGTAGLRGLLDDPHVVAVGECGLDFHYNKSPAPEQRTVFAEQIGMAHETGLSLVIHTREAWDETLAILSSEGVPDRTVFHCFTGGPSEAERCLEVGALLSFSGIVTFPSAPELQEAARLCPLDRMMVETDAPFLAPVPHRGKPNRPALVSVVGAAIAELRGVDVGDIASATSANAERFYRLPTASQKP
ncbi:MAG: TatD family hydrolase [Microthrixaceae bacterium]|nr:TatD family hydrolase [Microthrixaceae bacterium]